MTRTVHTNHRTRRLALAIALASLGQQAAAMEFETGENLSIRWDNTAKYNAMYRVQDQSEPLLSDPQTGALSDDADLAFDKGLVSNRVDLLSELDLVWKETMGLRVSGAGWYDFAYRSESDGNGINDALGGRNTWGALSVEPGHYTDAANDLHKRDVELLDAFAFWNFSAGDTTGNVRAGRHTIYWGSSLLLGGALNGAAGAMVPIDVAKGFAVPGSEAQELFLPTNKLSTVVQLTPSLTLNAYYGLEWQNNRLPETGSYFSPAEVLTNDSEFFTIAAGVPGVSPRVGLSKVGDAKPDERGDFGFNLQYTLSAWDLETSAYYINYSDHSQNGLAGTVDFAQYLAVTRNPILNIWNTAAGLGFATPAPQAPTALASDALGIGQFKWAYKDDVDLFGMAFQKEIAGISVGLELVRRQNAPLPPNLGPSVQHINGVPTFSGPFAGLNALVPGALAAQGITRYNDFDFANADSGDYPGPVGDSNHIILNGVGFLNDSALWEGGNYAIELTAAWLDSVTENEHLLSPAVREDELAVAIGATFSPQYFQVFPGTDMTVPMSISYGIKNDSPIALGGNESIGNGSLGVEFLVNQSWTIGTKYNFFFGKHNNGLAGLLVDRDNVALTIKRTF